MDRDPPSRLTKAPLPQWTQLNFPKKEQNFSEFRAFRETDKSLTHELGSIERFSLLNNLCLHGAGVACWFITQEVRGSNTPFYKKTFYRFYRFFKINLEKTRLTETAENCKDGWITDGIPSIWFNTALWQIMVLCGQQRSPHRLC